MKTFILVNIIQNQLTKSSCIYIWENIQNKLCQSKYSCSIMIRLTCSWAPTSCLSSPPCPHPLDCRKEKKKGGVEPFFPASFHGCFLVFSLFFPPFLFRSVPLFSLMTNLSAAPVVSGCECSAWDQTSIHLGPSSIALRISVFHQSNPNSGICLHRQTRRTSSLSPSRKSVSTEPLQQCYTVFLKSGL